MAHAAGQDEQVPDTVAVAQPVIGGIEGDAGRITQAAGCQPGETRAAERIDQGAAPGNGEPAHRQVDEERDDAPPLAYQSSWTIPATPSVHTMPNMVQPAVPRRLTSVNGV